MEAEVLGRVMHKKLLGLHGFYVGRGGGVARGWHWEEKKRDSKFKSHNGDDKYEENYGEIRRTSMEPMKTFTKHLNFLPIFNPFFP